MSNDINHSQKGLNECQVGQQGMPNLDPPPPYCGEIDGCESGKREVNDQSLNWLKDTTNQKNWIRCPCFMRSYAKRQYHQ